MGRAARHLNGRVILYADTMTRSMKAAIEEVTRRRKVQLTYNSTHNITPLSISKPIRDRLVKKEEETITVETDAIGSDELESMTPRDRKFKIATLTKLMRKASRDLDFETAARYRDLITTLESTT